MIHIDIISCYGTAARRAACRDTWLARVPDGVECQFIVGTGDPLPGEPDVVQVAARDTYECLPEKVLAAMRHALETEGWDWYGKVDDDTYVHLPRLVAFLDGLPGDVARVGVPIGGRGEWYGGAGYFMRREVVEAIVRRHDAGEYTVWTMGFEDAMIGRAAKDAGYEVQGTERLSQFSRPQDYPTPDNDKISCHMCGDELMRQIHAGFREPETRQISKS